MGTGKKKIEIKRKEKKGDRMVTFSKRRKGLFKKAQELHSKTGADIAIVAFSPAGRPFTHGDPSFDATIDRYLRGSSSTVQETNHDHDSETTASTCRSWLEAIRVEAYDNVDELLVLKKELEVISGKLVKRINDELVRSFLVQP